MMNEWQVLSQAIASPMTELGAKQPSRLDSPGEGAGRN
jgi:hypothetical protein